MRVRRKEIKKKNLFRWWRISEDTCQYAVTPR